MPDNARAVEPGQPLDISAEVWNRLLAMLAQTNSANGFKDGKGAGIRTNCILVKNNTGGNVGRFGVLQLGDPIIDYATSQNVFESKIQMMGSTPSTSSGAGYGKFAITQGVIANGAVGQCMVNGLTVARLDTSAGAFGSADIIDSQTGWLGTHPAGSAQVVWKAGSADADGKYPAIVSLNYGGWWPRLVKGETSATILASSTGNVSYGGVTMSTRNPYSATDASSGVVCWSEWDPLDGKPSLVSFECA